MFCQKTQPKTWIMRITGINIPDDQRIAYSLTKIYGIGRVNVFTVLKSAKIDPDKRVKDLTKQEVGQIIKTLEKVRTEGDLRKEIRENINRLKSIRSYRGIRHLVGLPVRGQRTKTNARTVKGKKKTVGALSKEAWAKIEEQQKAAQATK